MGRKNQYTDQYRGRHHGHHRWNARDLYLKNQGGDAVEIHKEYGNVYLYARKGTAYQAFKDQLE